MDKKQKLKKISEHIVLKDSYLRNEEIDLLYRFVANFAQYDGLTKVIQGLSISYLYGRKYTRQEKTTYILKQDSNGINIVKTEQYYAHHIQIGKRVTIHYKAKDILSILRWFDIDE